METLQTNTIYIQYLFAEILNNNKNDTKSGLGQLNSELKLVNELTLFTKNISLQKHEKYIHFNNCELF